MTGTRPPLRVLCSGAFLAACGRALLPAHGSPWEATDSTLNPIHLPGRFHREEEGDGTMAPSWLCLCPGLHLRCITEGSQAHHRQPTLRTGEPRRGHWTVGNNPVPAWPR